MITKGKKATRPKKTATKRVSLRLALSKTCAKTCSKSTLQTSQNQRQESIAPPSSFGASVPKPIFDEDTAILRKYDDHFDTATSMMEELHQKKLEVDKLEDFLQQRNVLETLTKMEELRDAKSKINALEVSIRDEILLATGKLPEKGWEKFQKLGYAKTAPPVTSPVKRSFSVPSSILDRSFNPLRDYSNDS